MPARELITLQFGPYANHVGAHFWNAQDELFGPAFAGASSGVPELDADVLYRASEGGGHLSGAPSYTPRLLVYDARNSAGIAQAAAAWVPDAPPGGSGDTGAGGPLHHRPPPRQHAFQRYLRQLEAGAVVAEPGGDGGFSDVEAAGAVGSWGDYLKALYHPASLLQLGGRSPTGEQLGADAAAVISEDVPFDAFTMGGGLANEALGVDPIRRLLEGCDAPQGVQAVVDVDGGWGGLAADVLAAVREELPRGAMLVMGAVPPAQQHHHQQHQAAHDAAGAFDYASRSRASVRAVNLGLAFATFGGGDNDLGAHFVPLSLQAYADAVAETARAVGSGTPLSAVPSPSTAWFPGLGGVRPDSAYHTAALLATAWDGLTSPLRVRRGWGAADELLGCATAGDAGDTRADRAAHGPGGTTTVNEEEDRRSKHAAGGGGGNGGNGSPSAWFDPSLELDAASPMVSLTGSGAVPVTLGDLLAALAPSSAHRVSSLALGFPLPHPRASATQLHRLLLPSLTAAAKSGSGSTTASLDGGIHMAGLDSLAPLSWTAPLPARYYQRGGGAGGGADGALSSLAQRLRPLAHVAVLRGVGTHSVSRGRYTSSLPAYGRVLDAVLERSGCRTAGHAVLRTPTPLPLSFPAALFRPVGGGGAGRPAPPRYDEAGGALSSSSQGEAWHAPGQPQQPSSSAYELEDADAEAYPVPFCAPSLTYACTGPTYAPALRRVHADFAGRDAAVAHRFSSAAGASGGGGLAGGAGGPEDFAEVEAVLAQLVDDYAGASAGGVA